MQDVGIEVARMRMIEVVEVMQEHWANPEATPYDVLEAVLSILKAVNE